MDVAFPYQEAITKALRLSIGLIDHASNKHGQPVICWLDRESNQSVNQSINQSNNQSIYFQKTLKLYNLEIYRNIS